MYKAQGLYKACTRPVETQDFELTRENMYIIVTNFFYLMSVIFVH